MTALVETRVTADAEAPGARQHGRPLEVGLILLPLVVAVAAVRPLGDPDTWWHLRTGALILAEGLVDTDPWSFASTRSWLLHEWLSEVVMYSAYAVGGYAGVVALTAVGVAACAGLVMASCRRMAQPLIACAVFVLAIVAVMPGLSARPQLVSWVLLAAVCPSMRNYVAARRLPWWLLPVVWLWANLHGLWLTALVLFGFLVVGLAIEMGRREWRTTARFCGFGVLSVAVAALTPSGPALLLAPFHVREYAKFVMEWNPPSIASPSVACALLLVLIVVIDWARKPVVPPTTISYVVGATALGMLYSRTVPIIAIAVAPLAAAAAQNWCAQERSRLRLDRLELAIWAVVLTLVIPAFGFRLAQADRPAPSALVPTTNTALLAATERLQQLPGRARVLNEYELGGWLLWSAPDVSPGIDGRADIYSVSYFEGYVDALALRPGWERFVNTLDVDAALLLRQTPLSTGLQSLGWTVSQETDGLMVLLPPQR